MQEFFKEPMWYESVLQHVLQHVVNVKDLIVDCYNTIEEDRHGLEDSDDRNFFETLFH